MASFASLVRAARAATKEAKPFFSAVDKAVEEMPRNKGTGKEFLTELTKKPGVKKAELEDRGIKAALEARLGEKLTKDDVRKLMEEKPPAQVSETVMSDPGDYEEWLEKMAMDYYGEPWSRLSRQDRQNLDRMFTDADSAEYAQYQLPGGENYREILLKLPTFDDAKNTQLMELEANIRRMSPDDYPPGYVQSMVDKAEELKAEKARLGDTYQTSHFRKHPNVLAHMRVSDRMTPEGQKVLHVEEIQSDWHQEGRKKGYYSSKQKEEMNDDLKHWKLMNPGKNPEFFFAKNPQYRSTQNAVPDAPFKKNWHELAMKRLINYASENGYDGIAITPGAEQAKRYDLSKQISRVVYNPETETLNAFDNSGKSVLMQGGVSPERVEDYIGKEPAKRLFDSQNTKSDLRGGKEVPYHEIAGVDLQVGGEGMKGFYDKILPDYLRGFGKQYGADVDTLRIKTPDDGPASGGEIAEGVGLPFDEFIRHPNREALEKEFFDQRKNRMTPLHHFPITPQMREEVTSKGLPLYQKVGIPATGAGAGSGMLPEEEEPQYAMGGSVTAEYNTNPDMQDGGRVIQGPAFKRGGKVKFTDNPDTMYLEVNSKRK